MINREKVYNKYNGHCAYCGQKIEMKDMQVDHIIPKATTLQSYHNIKNHDDESNLNPSCRLCNHYKRSSSLNEFRNWLLGGIIERLEKIYIFRVALKYGMIKVEKWDKSFYFERQQVKKNGHHYKVIHPKSDYLNCIGVLTKQPSYNNCRVGWFTLLMHDGTKHTFAGDAIVKISKDPK